MPLSLVANNRTSFLKDSSSLSGEVFGTLINLSGRRRFTSQRLILYAVLASKGDGDALPISREALGAFKDAHDALVEGNRNLPGVFCIELHESYFGNLQADRKIRDFISLADRTQEAIEKDTHQASALLSELIACGTPVLAVLHQLTGIYEELAKRHAAQEKKQLRSIMSDIEDIAKQARMVSFNAQIIAARAGQAGREFSVVAGVLSDITGKIDTLVREAVQRSGK